MWVHPPDSVSACRGQCMIYVAELYPRAAGLGQGTSHFTTYFKLKIVVFWLRNKKDWK